MWQALIAPVFSLIDKLIPDEEARQEAKLKLLQSEGKQVLDEMHTQLSPILAEAQSADPWTSRARPSFMYVMYLLLLVSIPMGVLYSYDPEMASNITEGFKKWLGSIPESIINLFGMGYLGYTGARSFEKWRGTGKK